MNNVVEMVFVVLVHQTAEIMKIVDQENAVMIKLVYANVVQIPVMMAFPVEVCAMTPLMLAVVMNVVGYVQYIPVQGGTYYILNVVF